jgi:hypothetical protein
MKTKRLLDPMTGFILLHADIPAIIGSMFPDWLDVANNVMCPWHEDKSPSLKIYPDGGGKCFGCGLIIKDVVDLYAKCMGIDYNESQRVLYSDLIDPIPASQIQQFKKLLTGKPLEWLTIERNILPSTIARHDIGYDPHDNRIVVPIYDQFKFCRNMRRIAWAKGAKFKVTNTNGHGDCRIYPEITLALNKKVLLCEGELDCLVAQSFGLPAITWTGGAGSWSEEQLPLFRGKYVWVMYDNDDAGRAGSEKITAILKRYADRVDRVDASQHRGGLLRGGVISKDITDYSFMCPDVLTDLADTIKKFEIKKTEPKPKVCPLCHQEIKQ